MKNIIMIAFDCNPMLESESLVSFMTAYYVSKENNVYVITRPKCKSGIETWQSKNSNSNLHFIYIDCPTYKNVTDHLKGFLRTMLFASYLEKWMKKACQTISSLNRQMHIDVIHRVTPNSFRILPDLSLLSNPIKVLGPVGGAQEIPDSLMVYAKGKNLFGELMHRLVNIKTLHSRRYIKRLNQFDYILSCNKETQNALSLISPSKKSILMTDVGIEERKTIQNKDKNNSIVTFLWVGRFLFRKGLDFLLDALSLLKEEKFKVMMVGEGPTKKHIVTKSKKIGLDQKIEFVSSVPHDQIFGFFQKSDAFLFPSLRESGGTVLAEALSCQVPIIALDAGGANCICSTTDSILVSIQGDKKSIVLAYSEAIRTFLNKAAINAKKKNFASNATNKLFWENKARTLEEIYESKKNKKNFSRLS